MLNQKIGQKSQIDIKQIVLKIMIILQNYIIFMVYGQETDFVIKMEILMTYTCLQEKMKQILHSFMINLSKNYSIENVYMFIKIKNRQEDLPTKIYF